VSSVPTRPLGHSGLQTSVVGLGCNNFGGRIDFDATRRVVDASIEQGVTFFDTADRYAATRSEQFLGELLEGRRDAVILATKFGMDTGDGYEGPRGAREYIHRAIDASLQRLRTDVIDLYWYHRPDGVTPIGETLEALHELVAAGKIRAIGGSNFSAALIEEADTYAHANQITPISAIQNEYSLLNRDPETDGVLEICERLEIGFVPYYPLAAGLLTGKYSRTGERPEGARLSNRDELATDAQWDLIDALSHYAEQRGVALSTVAIGGLLTAKPVSSVISGATKPEQVAANAAAAAWQPTDADVEALRELLAGQPA
jgi:aryl-alcohol dehydrogenase-like predicted oxidoreductase